MELEVGNGTFGGGLGGGRDGGGGGDETGEGRGSRDRRRVGVDGVAVVASDACGGHILLWFAYDSLALSLISRIGLPEHTPQAGDGTQLSSVAWSTVVLEIPASNEDGKTSSEQEQQQKKSARHGGDEERGVDGSEVVVVGVEAYIPSGNHLLDDSTAASGGDGQTADEEASRRSKGGERGSSKGQSCGIMGRVLLCSLPPLPAHHVSTSPANANSGAFGIACVSVGRPFCISQLTPSPSTPLAIAAVHSTFRNAPSSGNGSTSSDSSSGSSGSRNSSSSSGGGISKSSSDRNGGGSSSSAGSTDVQIDAVVSFSLAGAQSTATYTTSGATNTPHGVEAGPLVFVHHVQLCLPTHSLLHAAQQLAKGGTENDKPVGEAEAESGPPEPPAHFQVQVTPPPLANPVPFARGSMPTVSMALAAGKQVAGEEREGEEGEAKAGEEREARVLLLHTDAFCWNSFARHDTPLGSPQVCDLPRTIFGVSQPGILAYTYGRLSTLHSRLSATHASSISSLSTTTTNSPPSNAMVASACDSALLHGTYDQGVGAPAAALLLLPRASTRSHHIGERTGGEKEEGEEEHGEEEEGGEVVAVAVAVHKGLARGGLNNCGDPLPAPGLVLDVWDMPPLLD
ncbi:unnamed protein product [Closterium sp. NIES-54]